VETEITGMHEEEFTKLFSGRPVLVLFDSSKAFEKLNCSPTLTCFFFLKIYNSVDPGMGFLRLDALKVYFYSFCFSCTRIKTHKMKNENITEDETESASL